MRRLSALLLASTLLAAPAAFAQDGHAGHGHAAHAPASAPAESHADHGHHHADFASDRLHVRVDGPEGAPDLILIPGLSSSPEVWDSTVAHLNGRYRVHRIHVQGFAGLRPRATPRPPAAMPPSPLRWPRRSPAISAKRG